MSFLQDQLCQFITLAYAPSPDKCEDAYCYSFALRDRHYLGIFDGSGGSGCKRYPRLKNKTGAFIASQTCAMVCCDELHGFDSDVEIDEAFAEHLRKSFIRALTKQETVFGTDTGIKGTMIRTLPSTCSLAVVSSGSDADAAMGIDILQAGDSRVYLMRPDVGLQQMTVDDVVGHIDALRNLYESAPMTNVINISEEFRLTHVHCKVYEPFAILCASDGVFGYVNTPMHFEKLVLDALMNADSFAGMERDFAQRVSAITADDSTAVMAFYGWKSLEQVKQAMAKRYSFITGMCQSVDEEATDEVTEAAWAQYKKKYYWQENAR